MKQFAYTNKGMNYRVETINDTFIRGTIKLKYQGVINVEVDHYGDIYLSTNGVELAYNIQYADIVNHLYQLLNDYRDNLLQAK